MYKKSFYFLLLALILGKVDFLSARTAFCKVSIADIVSHPLATAHESYQAIKQSYAQLPISWVQNVTNKIVCPRIYQLLKHEIVTVLEETEHEAYIEISYCFVAQDKYNQTPLRGWILKENISNSQEYNTYKNLLPEPLTQQSHLTTSNSVSLVSPYQDEDGIFYSAGTRFVIHDKINDFYLVLAYDHIRQKFKEIELPETICCFQNEPLSLHEKRILFCDLVTLWATIPNGCIPLVWGGASIGKIWDQDDYYQATRKGPAGKIYYIWERPHYDTFAYMGVDASNVILRAAQTVGIPYFCKNSTTAKHVLDSLAMYEWPQDGDLIWVEGGLLIINNLENNTAVTAMSYDSGYGGFIQLPLNALFKNITTYDDLVTAYQKGLPVTVLNRDGSEARTSPFELLKLIS